MAVPRRAKDAVNSPRQNGQFLPPWDLVCKCKDHWLFAATGADSEARKCPSAYAAERIGLTEQEVRNIAERERWQDEADLILGKFADRNHGAILRALGQAFRTARKAMEAAEREIEEGKNLRFAVMSASNALDMILKISGRPTANVEHNLSGLTEEQLQRRIDEIKREVANAV